MDKKKIEHLLRTCGIDALMVLAGVILLVNPDGATALVTKLLGWLLVIGGAVKLVVPAVKKQPILPGTWVLGGIGILLGVILLSRPLILANLIGRILGVILLIEGLHSLKDGGSRVLAAVTLVAGAVLVIMPRTLTNTVLAICGIVLMIIGAVNILSKLGGIKRLNDAKDPNIIDAE